MANCSFCGTDLEAVFTCEYCGGEFCLPHAQAEDHDCASLIFAEGEDQSPGSAESDEDIDEAAETSSEEDADESRVGPLLTVLLMVGLVAIAAIVLLSTIGGGFLSSASVSTIGESGDTPPEAAAEVNETVVEHAVHQKINSLRQERGSPPLRYDSDLSKLALKHSEDMAKNNYSGYTSSNGTTAFDRYRKVNSCSRYGEVLQATYYAENLNTDDGISRYETPEELASGIVNTWMKSPPHTRTIMSDSWSRTGIGIHVNEENKVLVTMIFCGMENS